MTLEDFFTLTEIKDGLTTSTRVEELVSVLKKEQDSPVKNIGDTTRQRVSVASTIIATENKDCLDLFIKLDGLHFLDGWLKDAQTFAKGEGDTFVDEAISLLLQALEKLQIDNERLISSGVCITVKNLLSYSNTMVQDRARTLFDNWKSKNVKNSIQNNEHSDAQVDVSLFQSVDDRCDSHKGVDHTASEGGCHDTVASVEGDISVREVSLSDGKADLPLSSDRKQSNNEAGSEVSNSDHLDLPSNNSAMVVKEDNVKSVHDNNDANDDLMVNRILNGDANPIDDTANPGHKDLDRDEVKDVGSHSEAKKGYKSKSKYFASSCGFVRLTKGRKNNDIMNHTNMDIEDGTVDALEVACLLAKEVEREVMGYDEQSASSSSDEPMSSGPPEGPESINGEEPEVKGPSNELPTMNNVCSESRDVRAQDMESSSQVTDSLRDPQVNTERSVCEFDLNQEFSSADPDHLAQFGEKVHSDGGPSSDLQQRPGFLDIDLNVAETGDSCVGSSPKRSETMKIDLNSNQTGEDVMLKMNGNILGHTQRSPSPASSSSCLQPSMRNFDLNDNPSHSSNFSNQYPFMSESSSHKTSSYVGPSDDSVISIFGVKVKTNAVLPQTHTTPPCSNKRVPDSLVDNAHLLRGGAFVGLGRAVPYGPSVYGYNGLAMGSLMSFPPGLTYGPNGPIPYMFDPRGPPFMPQILGPTPTLPPSYGQPSFGPNPDLNPGFTAEGVNRDPGFFRQFLGPGQLRDNLGPYNSGPSTGKRKEPDAWWDPFTTSYKHHQPPHL